MVLSMKDQSFLQNNTEEATLMAEANGLQIESEVEDFTSIDD